MKTIILFTLIIVAVSANAQKTELSLGIGAGADNASYFESPPYGPILNANFSLLRDHKYIQSGFDLDVSTISSDIWYIAPGAVVNKTINLKKYYLYFGCRVSYLYERNMLNDIPYYHEKYSGYLLGLQMGATIKIYRHWGLNTELALKRLDSWSQVKTDFYEPAISGIHHMPVVYQLPLNIALRYSF
jgi:hypothetical protein